MSCINKIVTELLDLFFFCLSVFYAVSSREQIITPSSSLKLWKDSFSTKGMVNFANVLAYLLELVGDFFIHRHSKSDTTIHFVELPRALFCVPSNGRQALNGFQSLSVQLILS